MWCAAIARNEVPEFEATWGSPSSTSRGEPESQDTTVESQEVTDQEVTGNLAVRDMTVAFEEVTETAVTFEEVINGDRSRGLIRRSGTVQCLEEGLERIHRKSACMGLECVGVALLALLTPTNATSM